MNLAITGFGELGQQLLGLARQLFEVGEVAVFDDLLFEKKADGARPFEEFRDEKFSKHSFLIGLGYKNLERKQLIINELAALGREMPALVHPTAFVHPTAVLGKAVYLYPLSNIDKNVALGDGCLVNNSAVVSHDGRLGGCCWLSPGCVLSGFVEIGEGSFLGTGCLVSNGVKIGAGARAAIGSVVTRDVPPGASVAGSPARLLAKKLELR